MSFKCIVAGTFLLWIGGSTESHAQQPLGAAVQTDGGAAVAAQKPPPKPGYSVPWGLRPAIAPNILRVDSAIDRHATGTVFAQTAIVGGKPFSSLKDLGFYARMGFVSTSLSTGASGTGATNPLLMALFTPEIAPSLRLAGFVGATVPVGSGGGNAPVPGQRTAVLNGVWARGALDNALMATNYQTLTGGLGLAWVKDGWTAQGEVTVLQLTRTRGEAVDGDAARTNFTAGAHFGRLLVPWLTASTELRLQRWITTPGPVVKDGTARGQATAGLGLRANLPVGSLMLRPGLAYFHPLDAPMSRDDHRVVQLDLPIVF